jgi:hypothetical protein
MWPGQVESDAFRDALKVNLRYFDNCEGTNVAMAPIRRHIDNAMVKAIARAFRWREMLENGTYATITEIAAAEKISETYVGRVLRLTLLAPDIVEATVGRRQPAEVTQARLMRPFPVGWMEQRKEVFAR